MNKGIGFALSAAILNAFVGVFSLSAFASGLAPGQVAFYKCLIGFIFLTLIVFSQPSLRKSCLGMLKHAHQIAFLSVYGVFVLYYFETRAYQYASIAAVTFTTLGASTVTTFFCTKFVLKIAQDRVEWLSLLFALTGLIVLQRGDAKGFELNEGLIFAMIAGVGYGLFLIFNKRLKDNIQGSLAMLWWLLLFGCLFLFIPFITDNPALPNNKAWLSIISLALGSTVGGFYCTTKALSLASATCVQLFELTEPLFASLLGFLIFNQSLSITDGIGALFILSAISITIRNVEFTFKNTTTCRHC